MGWKSMLDALGVLMVFFGALFLVVTALAASSFLMGSPPISTGPDTCVGGNEPNE